MRYLTILFIGYDLPQKRSPSDLSVSPGVSTDYDPTLAIAL
jgi:hypothetical protein